MTHDSESIVKIGRNASLTDLWPYGGMQTAKPDASLLSLQSFLEDLGNAVFVARTLVEQGHAVDLTGYDRLVGLLCAKALDLPPEQGRQLRDDLMMLVRAVDALACALAPAASQA